MGIEKWKTFFCLIFPIINLVEFSGIWVSFNISANLLKLDVYTTISNNDSLLLYYHLIFIKYN